MPELKTIATDLPVQVLNMVNAIAIEKKRQLVDIINEALLLHVKEWEEYKIAIQRLKDPTDPILSEKDFLA